MSRTLRFVGKDQKLFFATLKQRVDDYFKENKISKHANAAMYLKTTLFLGGALAIYLTVVFGGLSGWANLGLCVAMGFFSAFIGFNVCHDAIHGSYSDSPIVNKLIGYTFNFIGANDEVWRVSHNQVHHTYTNIPGHDEDIEVAPGLVRLSPEEVLKPHMKYQHFYAFALYGFASLSWVFRKDFKKFFQKAIGQTENVHTPMEYVTLFGFKIMYYALFIAVPLMVMDIAVWQYLVGFLTMHIVCGVTIGLVFQLAHVVEGTAFPYPNEDGDIEEAWAIHQMQTTANFARKSWLATFLCGGLNMQIEHHLFPKICHIHYPKISDIVKKTALEFEVPYIENATFFSALGSHYRTLKEFGAEALKEGKKLEPVMAE